MKIEIKNFEEFENHIGKPLEYHLKVSKICTHVSEYKIILGVNKEYEQIIVGVESNNLDNLGELRKINVDFFGGKYKRKNEEKYFVIEEEEEKLYNFSEIVSLIENYFTESINKGFIRDTIYKYLKSKK